MKEKEKESVLCRFKEINFYADYAGALRLNK